MFGPKGLHAGENVSVEGARETFGGLKQGEFSSEYSSEMNLRGLGSLDSALGATEVDLRGLDSLESALGAAEGDRRGLDSLESALGLAGAPELDLRGLD